MGIFFGFLLTIVMAAAASLAVTNAAHIHVFIYIYICYIYIYCSSVTTVAATNLAHICAFLFLFYVYVYIYCSSVTNVAVTGLAHMRAFFFLSIYIYIYGSAAVGTVTGPPDDANGTFIYISLLITITFTLVLDITMHSPTTPPHPHGSSRMTDGVFRGRALGNKLNAADFKDVKDVLHPIPGKVYVYSSNQDPANLSIESMKPSAFIKHIVTTSIEPVLTKVAEKYSPIRSE